MKKAALFVGSVIILSGLFCLLGWNCYRVYLSERMRIEGRVEASLKNATDFVQNYNGSLLSNMAGSLIDSNYSDKVSFAAGFMHNRGKMAKIFFDEEAPPPPPPNAEKPLIVTDTFLRNNHIVYKPAEAMGIPQFDSVFRLQLKSVGSILYKIHHSSRADTSRADSLVSSPFILDFAQPRIYSLHYIIPRALVLKSMTVYIVSTLLVCVLLVGGAVFFYRGFRLQMNMSQFRESLVSNIAHELKTPLSSLQLIMDEAKKKADDEDSVSVPAAHIGFASSEINRMKLIVDRILSFSKMSTAQLAFNKERVKLAKVVSDAAEVMELTAARLNGKIKYDTNSEITVDGDPVLLVNAVSAIVDNALKYSGDAPEISLDISEKEGDAVLAIRDNGPGIPKQFRTKIFEPLFRIPTGNVYDAAGHGLGLSLVKQIMKLHNGDVSFVSSGQGTTFYLKFKRS